MDIKLDIDERIVKECYQQLYTKAVIGNTTMVDRVLLQILKDIRLGNEVSTIKAYAKGE